MFKQIWSNQRFLALFILGFGLIVAYKFRLNPQGKPQSVATNPIAARGNSSPIAISPPSLSPIFVTPDSLAQPSSELQVVSSIHELTAPSPFQSDKSEVYYPKTFAEGFAKTNFSPSIPREYPLGNEPFQPVQPRIETSTAERQAAHETEPIRTTPSMDSHWPDRKYAPADSQSQMGDRGKFHASLNPPGLITNQTFSPSTGVGILSSAPQTTRIRPPSESIAPRERIQSHIIRQPVRTQPAGN